MSPGLKWEYSVVITRTQPVDSCMMVARINRLSTPVELATSVMAFFISSVSASLLRGTPQASQEGLMSLRLASNLGIC